ncbi:MAG TPA: VanZ family protein [Candidatus Eisenbacteria bacterium]
MNRIRSQAGVRALRFPAIGYTLFVVYGCLVPLRFAPVAWAAALARYRPILTLHLGRLYRSDFTANVILFAVFAFLWAGVLGARPRGFAGILRSAAVWLAGLLFVMALEFAQIYVPARSVSFYDVIAGSIGAAMGVIGWWIAGDRVRAALDRWGEVSGREGVARWLLPPYVAFLLLYDLMPLDLTSSPHVIYEKWHRGMIHLVPFSGLGRSPIEALWSLGIEAALWLPLPALWTIGRGAPSVGWCLTVLLAMAVEAAQLLVQSRVCDVTDVICAAAGGALGAWLGTRIRPRGPAAAAAVAGHGSRAPWVALVAFFGWAAFVAAASWYPYDFEYVRAVIDPRVGLLFSVPFRAYWTGTEYVAFDELLKNVFLFVPLGVALAVVFARVRGARARRAAAAGSVAAIGAGAFLIEAVQVFLPSKTPDSADWLLAAVGGAAGYAGARAIARRMAAAPPRTAAIAPDPAPRVDSPPEDGATVRRGWTLRGAAIALAVGYAALVSISAVAALSPGVPYNVRELFGRGGTALAVAGFPLVLFAAFAPPLLAARWAAHDGWRRAAYLPALALAHALAAWVAVRAVVPMEAIHDVVGSPVLEWPLELEMIGRFVALFGAVSMLLTGGALLAGFLAGARRRHYGRAFLRWAVTAVPALAVAHWVVVTRAATDNLTELMAGGGGLGASVMLGAWLLAVATGGSALAALPGRGTRRVVAAALAAATLPVGWIALTLGTAGVIEKYDRTFSAMQFLLSPDRAHYVSGAALIARYAVAHAGLLVVIALTQAPARLIWRRHGERRKQEGPRGVPRGGPEAT